MLLSTHDGYHKLHPASLINCTRSLDEQKKGCTMACIQKQLQCPYNAKAAVFCSCSVVLAADVVFYSCCIEFYVSQRPLISLTAISAFATPWAQDIAPRTSHLSHLTHHLADLTSRHADLASSHLTAQNSQLATHTQTAVEEYIHTPKTNWLAGLLADRLAGWVARTASSLLRPIPHRRSRKHAP